MSNIESKEEKRHLLKETVYKAPVYKYSECKYIQPKYKCEPKYIKREEDGHHQGKSLASAYF